MRRSARPLRSEARTKARTSFRPAHSGVLLLNPTRWPARSRRHSTVGARTLALPVIHFRSRYFQWTSTGHRMRHTTHRAQGGRCTRSIRARHRELARVRCRPAQAGSRKPVGGGARSANRTPAATDYPECHRRGAVLPRRRCRVAFKTAKRLRTARSRYSQLARTNFSSRACRSLTQGA